MRLRSKVSSSKFYGPGAWRLTADFNINSMRYLSTNGKDILVICAWWPQKSPNELLDRTIAPIKIQRPGGQNINKDRAMDWPHLEKRSGVKQREQPQLE